MCGLPLKHGPTGSYTVRKTDSAPPGRYRLLLSLACDWVPSFPLRAGTLLGLILHKPYVCCHNNLSSYVQLSRCFLTVTHHLQPLYSFHPSPTMISEPWRRGHNTDVSLRVDYSAVSNSLRLEQPWVCAFSDESRMMYSCIYGRRCPWEGPNFKF